MRSAVSLSLNICGLLGLILAQLDCQKPRTASIEAIEADQTRQLAFTLSSLTGKRDGGSVTAILKFEGVAQLELRLQIDLGPPVHLSGGTYSLRRDGETRTGSVEASSLDFQAGQSGGMSLGGRFLLFDRRGTSLYRVTLPNTPFETAYH